MASQVNRLSGALYPGASLPSASGATRVGKNAFDSVLSEMLQVSRPGAQINEEQLFSALIHKRLSDLAGEDVAERYGELVKEREQNMQRGDGYVPVEAAAGSALATLVEEGSISRDMAKTVKTQSFRAAQLDNNLETLYDSRGSTVAVAMVDLAIERARETLEGIENGTIATDISSQETAVSGNSGSLAGTFKGGDGFLFKPVSESNGNLAILLPKSMQGDVVGITLFDNLGNSLETGQSYGPYEDGRPLFRFARPGAAYPDHLTVQVHLESGEVKEYSIPDSARRWE